MNDPAPAVASSKREDIALAARPDRPGLPGGVRPLVGIRTTGRRPPLFLVHAAAGDVFFLGRLSSRLDQEQPVYGLQARGLEDGEAPHKRFESMADDYLAAIRKVQPAGPYLFGGYCVGGLIAMLMSQRLQAAGEKVALLLMIDPDFHPAAVPWLYWRNPDAPHIRLMILLHRAAWALRQLRTWLQRALAGAPNPTKPTVNPSDGWRQKSVLQGMRHALQSFRPARYDGDITILCSSERRARLNHRAFGWQSRAHQVTFIEIAARHDEIFQSGLQNLASHLQSLLDRRQSGCAPVEI